MAANREEPRSGLSVGGGVRPRSSTNPAPALDRQRGTEVES